MNLSLSHHSCPVCGGQVRPFPLNEPTRFVCSECDLDILCPVTPEAAKHCGVMCGISEVSVSMLAIEHGTERRCTNTICGLLKS